MLRVLTFTWALTRQPNWLPSLTITGGDENACYLVLRGVHIAPEPKGPALVGNVLIKGVEVVHQLDHPAHSAVDVYSVEGRQVSVE